MVAKLKEIAVPVLVVVAVLVKFKVIGAGEKTPDFLK